MDRSEWYRGIDFAIQSKKLGKCFIQVDGCVATPVFSYEGHINGTGVDCPFGTSRAFSGLLVGDLPNKDPGGDGFQTRATERWLRDLLWNYRSNTLFKSSSHNSDGAYVNKTGHVRASLGLVIVPALLSWFFTECGSAAQDATTRLEILQKTRLGEHSIVEAHPRAFLYSVIERICNAPGAPVNADFLWDVAGYKELPERRRLIYAFVTKNHSRWLWDGLTLGAAPDALFDSDHTFDAWLSALTALAHARQQTVCWQTAGLCEADVRVEGHILVLS